MSSRDGTQRTAGPPGGLYAGFVWAVASLFYLYEYVLRVAPAVMVGELMQHFAVSAAALGALSAFYFYAYAPMQLVVGVLLDRFGGRKTMALAAACCTAGTLLFATTGSYWVAGVGRSLMGIGSAFAFVGALYVATNWFPAKYFAILSGATTTLGMLGGAAQTPLAVIVGDEGWQPTLLGVAGLGFLLLVLLWYCVPNRPAWSEVADPQQQGASGAVLHYMTRVLRNPQTWVNGLYAGLVYVPTSAFAALWALPYLEHVYGLDKTVAATIASSVFVGWAFGGPAAGWWSDQIRRRKPPLIVGAIGVLVTISAVIYIPDLRVWQLYPLMFLMGFFSGGQVVVFAVAHECNPAPAKGSSLAVTNMLCMSTGALLQPVIGLLLDRGTPRAPGAGAPVFSVADYRLALSVLPIFVFGALVLTCFVHETHARPTDAAAGAVNGG